MRKYEFHNDVTIMSNVIRTKISKGFQTVVPAPIRDKFGCGPGDEVLWTVVGDDVFIHVKRKTKIDPILELGGQFQTPNIDNSTANLDETLSE